MRDDPRFYIYKTCHSTIWYNPPIPAGREWGGICYARLTELPDELATYQYSKNYCTVLYGSSREDVRQTLSDHLAEEHKVYLTID